MLELGTGKENFRGSCNGKILHNLGESYLSPVKREKKKNRKKNCVKYTRSMLTIFAFILLNVETELHKNKIIVVTYFQFFQTYAYYTFFGHFKKYLKILDTKANFQAFV